MPVFPSNGRVFARRRPPAARAVRATVLAGALALAFTGCASMARHARGPMPTAALPPAEIRLTVASRPGAAPETIPDGRRAGTVRRVSADRDPVHGFTVWLADPRGQSLRIRVTTLLADVVPDLPRGRLVTIDRSLANGDRVRMDDDRGSVAWFHGGDHVPEMPAGLPFQVVVSPRRSYTRVFAAPDLCRWTVVHTHLSVTPAGGEPMLLAPGETRLFETPAGTYLFAALDASTPEESDCGQEGDPHVSWFWIRVPPDDVADLARRHLPVTTAPRGAGPATPSPSPPRPPSG